MGDTMNTYANAFDTYDVITRDNDNDNVVLRTLNGEQRLVLTMDVQIVVDRFDYTIDNHPLNGITVQIPLQRGDTFTYYRPLQYGDTVHFGNGYSFIDGWGC